MNSVDLPYARLRYETPIVYIQFKDQVDIGYPEVRELVRNAEMLSGYRPYVVLSDARKTVSVTPEGKKLSVSPSLAPLHCGTAILVDSRIIQIAAAFFGKLTNIPFPLRVFTEEQKAIDWLKSLYAASQADPFWKRA
jgi:hypothetical protein